MDDLTKQAMREWTLAQPRVSAFVLSVVRHPADRDDVLQETAIAVVESFGSFDQSKPFLKWAMGIARNQVRMYLRRRRRDQLTFDEETVAAIEGAFVRTSAQQSRRMDFLQDCLQLVKGRAKRLCELRYRDDLKPAAISEQVEMSTDAVKKALQRVRDQLRDCIARKAATDGGSR